MADVVYALSDTWISEFLYTRRGEYFFADDPAVLAHPAAFSKDPPEDCIKRTGVPIPEFDTSVGEPVVEQATAAPGEKRNTGRSK
jgi:hypothetical protein